MTGIEPASPAWEAGVLPMNYICTCSYYSIRNPEIKPKNQKRKQRKRRPGGPGAFSFLMRGEIVIFKSTICDYYNIQMCSKYVHFLKES